MTINHDQCREQFHRIAAEHGIDIVVSTAPPLVEGPYPAEGLTCPHGTTYWTQPTGEQIAKWVRDGVR